MGKEGASIPLKLYSFVFTLNPANIASFSKHFPMLAMPRIGGEVDNQHLCVLVPADISKNKVNYTHLKCVYF